MSYVKNPIREGFYPDPSICRVDEDYYCVHSSFAYAPGIPIFKSRDLVSWEQIGHVLMNEKQLQLQGAATSGGIYAPTIRYEKGIFYVIVTNVTHGGNFYVTAENPAGPWSEPFALEGAEGIDPSLYFEDGHCYYIGQRTKKNAAYFGDCEIWVQEIDLIKHELMGDCHVIYDGALKRAYWPEGPHIYKKDDYYYLVIAEGGTEYAHSVCVARSRQLFGPYENCPWNPIFTHRNLGHQYPVQNVGHGELFSTIDGKWYMALLGTRPVKGHTLFGRETFLADITWEEDWPVVNAGEGKLREWQKVEITDSMKNAQNIFAQKEMEVLQDTMEDRKNRNLLQDNHREMEFVGLRENILCSPAYECSITENVLTLPLLDGTMDDCEKIPAYLGIRFTHLDFYMTITLSIVEGDSDCEAGLICYYDEKHFVRFFMEQSGEKKWIKVIQTRAGMEKELTRLKCDEMLLEDRNAVRNISLCIKGTDQKIEFTYGKVGQDKKKVAEKVDISYLCSEEAGGFTGCTVGVYGISHEQQPTASKKVLITQWDTDL